jgi:hypothetical protein
VNRSTVTGLNEFKLSLVPTMRIIISGFVLRIDGNLLRISLLFWPPIPLLTISILSLAHCDGSTAKTEVE